jgi:hypothetical protein
LEEDDVGVVDIVPTQVLAERRLEDADDLPVDIVDGRREEQQAEDDLARASDSRFRYCDGGGEICGFFPHMDLPREVLHGQEEL